MILLTDYTNDAVGKIDLDMRLTSTLILSSAELNGLFGLAYNLQGD